MSRIIDVLVNNYNPQKIILFGSLANGNVHEYSDIDLVVIKDSDKNFYERLKEVALLTLPKFVGADILVYTQKNLSSRKIPYSSRKKSLKKAG